MTALLPPKERTVQRAVLRMLGECFPNVISHHAAVTRLFGTKTQRAMQMGAMKGDGFRPGFPDLLLLWATTKGLFVEVKRPKLGKLSDAQVALHERLVGIGWPVAVVTTVDEAYWLLRALGAPWNGIHPAGVREK